ncbi:MAG: 1-(5-phosphoribosyl)-5-[(5-phosphoribosylamino)methylideneamino]imidazole-4-carboxamide isomerase [Clostridia bacterium]|nr:1-(5-phosphoribosyl)-5-[(5-phosphoribosylamino)methylideneamino]imidazole-4-carboxamide isomerase [Clostridia bacterium]
MKIFPAIDIIEGKVVRLSEGDYDKVTNYKITPLEAARAFCADGATHLHIVDLDGAKVGRAVNSDAIKEITSGTSMFVEVGGGIRNLKQMEEYLNAGASRVILGTAAITHEHVLVDAIKMFGEKVAVGIDEKDGFIRVRGWKEATELDAFDYCRKLSELGVKNIVFTDISKDGMLGGVNDGIFRKLGKIDNVKFTAAGGITTLEDIEKLKDAGVFGAVIGKAIYERKIALKDALALED